MKYFNQGIREISKEKYGIIWDNHDVPESEIITILEAFVETSKNRYRGKLMGKGNPL